MRAIVLERPGVLRATDVPAPAAAAEGVALVRVRRIGVCGTDFHAWHGRQPFFTFPRVLGHELGVEIVEVGANARGFAAGDRCAVEPYLNCGACRACRLGRGNCCEHMQVLGVHVDGGMRERLAVPIGKLHPSRVLDFEALALVETVGVGAHAVRRAGIGPGDQVLVVGTGPIGLAVAVTARAAGATVVVSDVSRARLDVAGAMGFRETIQVGDADPAALVRERCGGLPPVVIDATGSARSMHASFGLVGHAGTLVFVGLVQADLTFSDPDFHRRELTVLASRNALPDDFARVIADMEAGRIDARPWITHRAGLDEVPSVFPAWTSPGSGVVKAIIGIDE